MAEKKVCPKIILTLFNEVREGEKKNKKTGQGISLHRLTSIVNG